MAGIKKVKFCKKCKGIGRLRAEIDSKNWKRGQGIITGLGTRWRR